ncbi:MAG: GIY-YIG nuclease family protein [Candidatus Nanohaloarchaea archaeon]|nr:GIY-YIG nuclease family protein [Candidatus Nanohaloarchaea archaeon]
MNGTYTLLIRLAADAAITVGALGELEFDHGFYGYTGSAFGPGGFARVDRHRRTAAGDNETRHWHIDHLLAHPEAAIVDVFTLEGEDRECDIAQELPGEPVDGFGASDCSCGSHLMFSRDRDELAAALASVYPSNSSEI